MDAHNVGSETFQQRADEGSSLTELEDDEVERAGAKKVRGSSCCRLEANQWVRAALTESLSVAWKASAVGDSAGVIA